MAGRFDWIGGNSGFLAARQSVDAVTNRVIGPARGDPHILKVARELAQLAKGDGPIVAGPWISGVGRELLYWIPFLNWAIGEFGIDPGRVTAVSRGGVASWYRHVAGRYVELFDAVSPDGLRTLNSDHARSSERSDDRELDRITLDMVGLDRASAALHPGVMGDLFEDWWVSGTSASRYLDHVVFRGFDAPDADLVRSLPPSYVAVKFHSNSCLPLAEAAEFVARFVTGLADDGPVVLLNNGFQVGEHVEINVADHPNLIRIASQSTPGKNLLLHSAIIARASHVFCTAGGYSYIAPMHGVPATGIFAAGQRVGPALQQAGNMLGEAVGTPVNFVDTRTVERVLRVGATRLKAFEAEYERVEQDAARLGIERSESLLEVGRLTEELAAARAEVGSLVERYGSLESGAAAEAAGLAAACADTSDALAKARDELASLKQELAEVRGELAAERKETEALQGQRDRSQAEAKGLSSRYDGAVKAHAKASAELAREQKSAESLKGEMGQAQAEAKRLGKELASARDELVRLTHEFDALKKKSAAEGESLAQRCADAVQELAAVRGELAAERKETEALQGQRDRSQAEVKELSSRFGGAVKAHAKASTELARAKKTAESLKGERGLAQAEAKRLGKELAATQKELVALIERYSVLETGKTAEAKELSDRHEAATEALAKTRADLAAAAAESAKLRAEVDGMKTEHERLAAERQALEEALVHEMERGSASEKRARNEIRDLTAKLAAATATLAETQDRLAEANALQQKIKSEAAEQIRELKRQEAKRRAEITEDLAKSAARQAETQSAVETWRSRCRSLEDRFVSESDKLLARNAKLNEGVVKLRERLTRVKGLEAGVTAKMTKLAQALKKAEAELAKVRQEAAKARPDAAESRTAEEAKLYLQKYKQLKEKHLELRAEFDKFRVLSGQEKMRNDELVSQIHVKEVAIERLIRT